MMIDEQRAERPRAALERRVDRAGAGCLIQGLGVIFGILILAAFTGLAFALSFDGLLSSIASVAGVALALATMIGMLVVGARLATYRICGNCGNRVASREARICPVCHARFDS